MTKHKHYEHIIAFANGEILQKAVYGKDTWEDDLNPTFEDWQIYRVKPDEPKMYLKAEEIPRGTDCWTLNSYLASYKGEWYKGGIDIKLINARTVYFTEEAAIKAQNSKQAYIAIVNKIEEINRQENWVADFSDFEQSKYFVRYDHDSKIYQKSFSDYFQIANSEWYGCEKAIKYVIANMQSELDDYFYLSANIN